MKKILTSAIAVAATLPMFAGLNTMNYQTVLTATDGTPLKNTEVALKFELKNGEKVAYTQSSKATTNDLGLLSCEIGTNDDLGLSAIDWADGDYVLTVSVDLNGDGNFDSVYSSTVQSVPTAVYSVNGAEALEMANFNSDEIFAVNGKIEQLTNTVNSQFEGLYENLDMTFSEQVARWEYQEGLNENFENGIARAITELEDLQTKQEEDLTNVNLYTKQINDNLETFQTEVNDAYADQANMNENFQNGFIENQAKWEAQEALNENYQNGITRAITELEELQTKQEEDLTNVNLYTKQISDNLETFQTEVNDAYADQANMNENFQNGFIENQAKWEAQEALNENYQNGITRAITELEDLQTKQAEDLNNVNLYTKQLRDDLDEFDALVNEQVALKSDLKAAEDRIAELETKVSELESALQMLGDVVSLLQDYVTGEVTPGPSEPEL